MREKGWEGGIRMKKENEKKEKEEMKKKRKE